MFTLNPSANADGTYKVGSISVPPAQLVKVFGKPESYGEGKVSGEYTFKSDDGHVFTVYDWKCTSRYDRRYQSPESFWASEEPQEFSVGGKAPGRDFIQWLLKEIGCDRRTATKEKLLEKLTPHKGTAIEEEITSVLHELVIDAKSEEATRINNADWEKQLAYLFEAGRDPTELLAEVCAEIDPPHED